MPTLKVATNLQLAQRKEHWIDFDAGAPLARKSVDELLDGLWQQQLAVANGELHTKNKTDGLREIALFKLGVAL